MRWFARFFDGHNTILIMNSKINSARKRPIPYHRPTPSSTSSDSEGAEESDQNHSSPYNLKECSNNLFQSIPNGNKSVYN